MISMRVFRSRRESSWNTRGLSNLDEVRKLKFVILVIQLEKICHTKYVQSKNHKKTFLWDENKMQWYFDGVLKRTEKNPGKFYNIYFEVFTLFSLIIVKLRMKLGEFIFKTLISDRENAFQ